MRFAFGLRNALRRKARALIPAAAVALIAAGGLAIAILVPPRTADAQVYNPVLTTGRLTVTAPSGANGITLREGARISFDGTRTLRSDGSAFRFYGGSSVVFENLTAYASTFRGYGTNSATVIGGQADGASAIGVRIGNANVLGTSGAKIASFYSDNAASEKAYMLHNGTFVSFGRVVATDEFAARLAGVAVNGNATDGAAAVGVTLGNLNTLTQGKIARFCSDNATTCANEKASIDKDGILNITAIIATSSISAPQGFKISQTFAPFVCSAANEGLMMRSGGSGSVRSKLCYCTSDGAASPTYAWQNMATAAIGNTSTCP